MLFRDQSKKATFQSEGLITSERMGIETFSMRVLES